MSSSDSLRRGFTLIELLVVITILAFLAALTALFFPRFQERHQVESGSAKLSSWLLIAKQMARRDGVPTGVHFMVVNNLCTQCQYVQQPDILAQGRYVGHLHSNARVALFKGPGVDQALTRTLTRNVLPPGDYLEIYGGGPPRLIHQYLGPDRDGVCHLQLDAKATALPASGNPGNAEIGTTDASPTNYRIILQPRPIPGEQVLNLPTDVVIDVAHSFIPTSGGNYQVIFTPSGSVVGNGARTKLYHYFYLRDNGQDTQRKIMAGKLFEGNPRLIAVYLRTGFIATHQVNPNTTLGPVDYFLKDGRSSGM